MLNQKKAANILLFTAFFTLVSGCCATATFQSGFFYCQCRKYLIKPGVAWIDLLGIR